MERITSINKQLAHFRTSKNEDGEKLYSIGETLESEGKSLGKELNEIAGTFETLIDSLLTTLEGENTK